MLNPVELPVSETETQIRDALIAKIHGFAENEFRDHVLTQKLDVGMYRAWRAAKPQGFEYHFNITTQPGSLFVTGDIGTLVLERTEDMVAWCRGAVGSIDYFASKVAHEIPTSQYDPDIARAWLYRTLKEDQENDCMSEMTRESLTDLYLDPCWEFGNQHETITCIYDSGVLDGVDFPDFNNYTSSFLWCREAVIWFLKLLDSSAQGSEPMSPEVKV